MLICKALRSKTTGEEIFKIFDFYFEKHHISWDLCHHVCTDGAKAMLGSFKGLVARIKQKNHHVTNNHCCLHRHALAVKKMPEELKGVLNDCVKIVNFIKSRPLNSRLFTLLCEDMGSLHKTLLLHTEVRWLSRGKVLTRFFELRDEIRIFLTEHSHELSNKLNDLKWLQQTAYLSDIFSYFNEVSLSLQGPNTNIFKVKYKINGSIMKLKFWADCILKGNTECFYNLHDILVINNAELDGIVKTYLMQHLSDLQNTFLDYFPAQSENFDWVQNPFIEYCDTFQLQMKEREELIDISTDFTLKSIFTASDIFNFWLQIYNQYPELSKRAIKILMPFVTTYMCEKSFSLYIATKTKYRNRLDAEDDMRLQITTIIPNFDEICNEKQAQPSH